MAAAVDLRQPSFAQVPINVLMDHNDGASKQLGTDFLQTLRVHGEAEELAAAALVRALRSETSPKNAADLRVPQAQHMCMHRKAAHALRSFMGSVGRAHAKYSKQCAEEVWKPLETALSQGVSRHARIKTEWNRVVKGYLVCRDKLLKSKKAHAKATESYRAACSISMASERRGSGPSFTDADKVRMRVHKADEARRQADAAERECIKELHQCISDRDHFIRDACRAYQQLEEERMTTLKGALIHLAGLEREHLQARLQEVDSFQAIVEGIDVKEGVHDFIVDRRDPDATHLYHRALVVLEWGWLRQQRMRRKKQQQRNGDDDEGRQPQQQGGEEQEEGEQDGGTSPSSSSSSSSSSFMREKIGIDAILGPLFASSSSSSSSSPVPPPSPSSAGGGATFTAVDDNDDDNQDNGDDGDGDHHHVEEEEEEEDEQDGGQPRSSPRSVPSLLLSPTAAVEAEGGGEGAQPPAQQQQLSDVPFSQLIEHERGRAYFIRVLNQGRGRYTDVGSGYDELASCLEQLLDKCLEKYDVRAAQQTMQMGNTFFRSTTPAPPSLPKEGEGDHDDSNNSHRPHSTSSSSLTKQEKEYLLSKIRAHPIWRSQKLWQDALMLGVADQFDLCPQQTTWDNLTSDALREAVIRVHNTVFGQLGSLAFNMVECGMPLSEIQGFILTMCERAQLGEDQVLQLVAILQSLAGADIGGSGGGGGGGGSSSSEVQASAADRKEGQVAMSSEPSDDAGGGDGDGGGGGGGVST